MSKHAQVKGSLSLPPGTYWWQIFYRGLLHPLLMSLLWLGALFQPKWRATWQQRNMAERLLSSVLRKLNKDLPLVWFHVASAGEFLQALPIIEQLIACKTQCVVSFTSPSAANWIKRAQLEHPHWLLSFPFPLDKRSSVKNLLQQLNPAALILIKYDLWPNLIWEARLKQIPIHLFGVSLHKRSAIFLRFARRWLRCLLSSISYVSTVSKSDVQFLSTLCPTHHHIKVLGDGRFDNVLKRIQTHPPPVPLGISKSKQILVAGSTWPPDEHVLLPAIKQTLKKFPQFAVLLAPHEPTPTAIKSLEKALKEFGCLRLSQVSAKSSSPARVLLLDEIGHLASSYKLGTMAYVGGGFTTGVHNVLEPAVAALPVCFGPLHQNSPEACDMIRKKLAFCISNTQTFQERLLYWLSLPQNAIQIGKKSRQFVTQQAGTSEACCRQILKSIA